MYQPIENYSLPFLSVTCSSKTHPLAIDSRLSHKILLLPGVSLSANFPNLRSTHPTNVTGTRNKGNFAIDAYFALERLVFGDRLTPRNSYSPFLSAAASVPETRN